MFTTQKGQELDLSYHLGDRCQHWLMVEHDLGVPWFHVSILQSVGLNAPRTFLVGDSGVLEDLLEILDECSARYVVQVVLPASHPARPNWVMRPLKRIETTSYSDGLNADIFIFEDDSSFEFVKSGVAGVSRLTEKHVLFEKVEDSSL